MGTWRWFSAEYCDATSSCVVVDAYLQLILCVSAVLFLVLLFLVGSLGSWRRWYRSSSSSSSRSKTAPMPLAVIQKDADTAHISGHKNSLKQASEFMRQTQRISKTDFATTDKDARTSDGRKLSFIGRIGGSFSRRSSRHNTATPPAAQQDAALERRRASHDMADASPSHPSSGNLPQRKLSNPQPLRRSSTSRRGSVSSTSRRGSVTSSSIEMEAVLGKAAGFNCERDNDHDGPNLNDATRRSSKASVGERGATFRHRLKTVFSPNFIRTIQQHRPSIPNASTAAPNSSSSLDHRAKKTPLLERSATTFEMPSYRKRQKLAALSLEHRKSKERRGSVELRDKRRLSVGLGAQIRFDVSDGHEASVYEVKLKEITLVKRLAFGPLSEVYAAIWRDTRVGVKLLMPREGVTDRLEDAVKNFRREIWVMHALTHANIVKLIGASLTPTCYVLVMEYMSNGALYDYLRDEANFFPHQMVLTSALDIADGMRHLHASGVLQRDLKSKNCLVSENLVVKIADFGLSRFAARRTPSEQYTFVGTPFWAAPEVIRHEPYDHKADVYSFAIVLWELVERKDPYEQLNAFQVPLQVANDGLRPNDFVRSAPLGLEQLMKQCWDANPDQRPSFDDVCETLQQWLAPTTDNDALLQVESTDGDDLSAHVLRERHGATERELHRFASSHDANARAIPIVLSRGKTDRLLLSAHHQQRRGSAMHMNVHTALPHRPHSERSISPASNHSVP